MTDTLEIEVTALGAGGDGIARRAGQSVILPGALPGETWRAHPAGKRGDALLAEGEALIGPRNPDRVPPVCPHVADRCGGCTLQHWAPAAQATWKHDRLAEALGRAGYRDVVVAPTVATPPRSRRRADFALRRRQDGSVAIGFHPRGGTDVIDLHTCEVLDPALFALVAPLRAVLRRLSALGKEGAAVVNLLDSGPDILLRTDRTIDATGRRLLAAFAAQLGLPRIAWAERDGLTETAAQSAGVRLDLSGVEVAPPPGAFLQATRAGEAAIIAAVMAGLPAKLPVRPKLLDLYAGIGTLSFPLAVRGRVTAMEGSAEAVAALDAAARKAVARVQAVRRDLARQPVLPAELKSYDLVVLDPPYAGAAEQVAQLARSTVRHLVYVSCNPVALARDAAVLRGAGFAVTAATPIDQFLWSAHLESVVAFTR